MIDPVKYNEQLTAMIGIIHTRLQMTKPFAGHVVGGTAPNGRQMVDVTMRHMSTVDFIELQEYRRLADEIKKLILE